jgi:uncharacterized phiE125 gp8 family phage protein
MNLTVIVPPPFEPVTLAEVYKQLRLDPDISSSPAEVSHPDDLMLAAQIISAREYVEVATRRTLVQRTLRLSCSISCGAIKLIRPPLVRVERVQFYDAADDLQLVDSATYYVTDDQVPELRFKGGAVPAGLDRCRRDAVRVEYVAGYAPAGSPPESQEDYTASIPQTLKQAVLIGVQLQYDNLSDPERTAMERMREAMLQTYRIQHV